MTDKAENLEAIIRHVASLARLKVSPTELPKLVEKAKAILAYIATLNELDTTTTPPMSHAFEADWRGREDRALPSTRADAILSLAPEREERFVVVPKVIDS